MTQWLTREGLSGGKIVQVNKWLRDPTGSGRYRIPDIRVPGAGRIFDATLALKRFNTPQIKEFNLFSGGDTVTLIRPSALGSYSINPYVIP